MSNLKASVQRLASLTGENYLFKQPPVFPMNRMTAVVEELGRKFDGDIDAKPLDKELEALMQKFLRGERNFSRQETRNLPFIIYHPKCTLEHVKQIIQLLNFYKERHLSRVAYVFFARYDDTAKTNLLRFLLKKVLDGKAADDKFLSHI